MGSVGLVSSPVCEILSGPLEQVDLGTLEDERDAWDKAFSDRHGERKMMKPLAAVNLFK